MYIQEQGATVGKTGENLKVTKAKATLLEAHLIDVSQVVLCGSVQITASALHLCAESGIPVVHLSMGHWFYGITQGMGLRNAYDRAAQFRQAAHPAFCLKLAQAFVAAKGQNQRTLLRRNGREMPERTLNDMAHLLKQVEQTANLQELLGIEGLIARNYFGQFPQMLRPKNPAEFPFDMDGRNRRPPKDPVNACLSFLYALLAKECTVALLAVGLDPHWGFFHQPRHGRPALALDLMEEFRAVVADSAVISAINTGMIGGDDFETNGAAWALKAGGRKSLIKAFELRMDQLITHPIFDYKISWRRVVFVQAQLLARVLRGELPAYIGIVTR
jgi:CRISPR-associated protein Cas1